MNEGRPQRRPYAMDFFSNNILTVLIFLPTVGAVLTLLARGRDAVRWTALATTIATFVVSLALFGLFDWNKAGNYEWLGRHREAVETFDWVLREMDPALASWRATVATDREAALTVS